MIMKYLKKIIGTLLLAATVFLTACGPSGSGSGSIVDIGGSSAPRPNVSGTPDSAETPAPSMPATDVPATDAASQAPTATPALTSEPSSTAAPSPTDAVTPQPSSCCISLRALSLAVSATADGAVPPARAITTAPISAATENKQKQKDRALFRVLPFAFLRYVSNSVIMLTRTPRCPRGAVTDGGRSATPLRKGVMRMRKKLFRILVCAAFVLDMLITYAK